MQYAAPEKKRTWLLVVIITVLILIITGLSMSLKEITVTGNERYTDEQIIQILFPDKVDRNTVFCYLKDRL